MEPAIRVENLSKSYRIGAAPSGKYRTLRESIADAAAAPWRRLRDLSRWNDAGEASENGTSNSHFWALKDVTFEVQPGEVVGIIGRNGAGKSTLLKILSRITEPTDGYAEFRGRIGSLLEVGTGFHPELSGRENIYLNGAILGMSRGEIARKFDEIIAFADIDRFLDTPVKRYSSGMYVRLAFAVAAHLDPEILVIDEVLAVGDVEFQRKCLGKMHDLSGSGRTILFVSHNMPAVRSLTNRCVYLQEGRLVHVGPTSETIDRYMADAMNRRSDAIRGDLDYYRRERNPESPVRINRLWVNGEEGDGLFCIGVGDDFTVCCEIESRRDYSHACVAFWLTNERGERVATMFSLDKMFPLSLHPGLQTVSCQVQGLPLSPGRYSITLGINEKANTKAFDVLVDLPLIEVILPQIEAGDLHWGHRPWGCVHWTNLAWMAKVNEG